MRDFLLSLHSELKARWRDHTLVVAVFAAPFAMAGLLLLAVGDSGTGPVLAGHTLVVAGDGAEAVAGRLGEETAGTGLKVVALTDSDQVRPTLDRDATTSALVMRRTGPSGAPPSVAVYRRAGSPLVAAIAEAAAAVLAGGNGTVATGADGVVRDVSGADAPPAAVRTAAARSTLLLFGLFVAAVEPRAFSAERRSGMWARCALSPARPAALLGAKLTTSVLLTGGAMGVCWGAMSGLLGVNLGPAFAVASVIAAAALAFAALHAAVARVARRSDSPDVLALVVTLTLAFLGGQLVPRYRLPDLADRVGEWLPNAVALDAFGRLAGAGLTGAALLAVVAKLIVSGAALAAVAARGGSAPWNGP